MKSRGYTLDRHLDGFQLVIHDKGVTLFFTRAEARAFARFLFRELNVKSVILANGRELMEKSPGQ